MAFDANGNPIEGGAAPEEEQQEELTTPEESEELDIGDLFDRAEAAEEQAEEGDPTPEQAEHQQKEQPGQPAQEPQPQPTYKVVVAGQERELTQEQLNQLAEQSENFATQQQHLNNERMRLESMQPLAQAWASDPRFRQMFAQYQQNLQQAPYPNPGQVPMNATGQMPGQIPQEQPLPEDPVEALIEQATREAVKRIQGVQEESRRLQQEQTRFQKEQEFHTAVTKAQNVVQADEMRGEVMAEIAKFAPEGSVLRANLRNPRVFFPTYVQVRDQLLAARQGERPTGDQPQQLPQPTRVQQRAPILEGGGGDAPSQQPTQKERARALGAKAAEGDLMAAGEMFDVFGD
ncbi:hypothetical protein [Maridesulfovibrio sp.]|uniref:hypothetical protein n=1 Tax=Maridesulfovibrio sp. TaxID=2795000 RepID=UPI002AA8FA49|nr:hypothetical protein [Maridesulfovibrio sp.]